MNTSPESECFNNRILVIDDNPAIHQDFRKILLIKLSAVGDVVHTIPVLNKLRRRYPSARIDWLVTPAIAEMIATTRQSSR